MSIRRFPIFLTLILVLIISIPNASAQDYTKWGLPAGAKLRIGKGTIKELQFSPDGTRLAVTTSIGIWLYDVQTWKEIDLFAAHTGSIESVSFSPDGKTLVSAGTDKTIRLWDVETGNLLKSLIGHTGTVLSVSFSPDGTMIASGGTDGSVLLWSADTGNLLKPLTRHTGVVLSVSFSSDSKTLASGSVDGTILLWDTSFHVVKLDPVILTQDDLPTMRLMEEGTGKITDASEIPNVIAEFEQRWNRNQLIVEYRNQLIVEYRNQLIVEYWLFDSGHTAQRTAGGFRFRIVAVEPNYHPELNPEDVIGDATWRIIHGRWREDSRTNIWFVKNNVLVYISAGGHPSNRLQVVQEVARKIEAVLEKQ